MILGPISFVDCFVFCVFLAPQLLINVGPLETFGVILQCLPFLRKSMSLSHSIGLENETKLKMSLA
jgi:hypothetical protein